LLLLDEFPVTVEQILKKDGVDAASLFLSQNRELRQKHEFQKKIRFIYTGSVGLLNVARKMKATDKVNDLRDIKVGPLKKSDAQILASELYKARLAYEPSATMVDYTLEKIGLYFPHYIQLITKEVQELIEYEELELIESTIDTAFNNLILNGNIYFQHYKDRLWKIFSTEEVSLVNNIMSSIKKSPNGLSYDEILNLAIGSNLQNELTEILETLLHDGYLLEKESRYLFYSIILKHWWK